MFGSLKVAANRSNALLSTGPRTAGGKLVSSRNALRHGVWAAAPVIPGEDPAAWEAHRTGILTSLAPVGLLEQTLAERAALTLWRLNRLARYEALTTAADVEDAVLPRPAGDSRLDAILVGRGDELGKALTAARGKLADTRKRLRRLRPAAEALPKVLAGAENDLVPSTLADTLLGEAHDLVCQYRLKQDPLPPGPRLWRKLGVEHPPAKRGGWPAGLVRQALGSYAVCVEEDMDWLSRRLAVVLNRGVHKHERQARHLARRLAGLAERWRKAAVWRAADVLMPKAGRDERIIRYESHLHKLLTSTLHELERLQAARAGKEVPLPAAVDVAVNVTG